MTRSVTASPSPVPHSLWVTKGWKIFGRSVSEIPQPLSEMRISNSELPDEDSEQMAENRIEGDESSILDPISSIESGSTASRALFNKFEMLTWFNEI